MRRNNPEMARRGRGLEENHHMTVNNRMPSRQASYSCDGWRTTPFTLKPHGRVVGFPHSSPLMKLPMRPKYNPSAGRGTVKTKTTATKQKHHQTYSVPATISPSMP